MPTFVRDGPKENLICSTIRRYLFIMQPNAEYHDSNCPFDGVLSKHNMSQVQMPHFFQKIVFPKAKTSRSLINVTDGGGLERLVCRQRPYKHTRASLHFSNRWTAPPFFFLPGGWGPGVPVCLNIVSQTPTTYKGRISERVLFPPSSLCCCLRDTWGWVIRKLRGKSGNWPEIFCSNYRQQGIGGFQAVKRSHSSCFLQFKNRQYTLPLNILLERLKLCGMKFWNTSAAKLTLKVSLL